MVRQSRAPTILLTRPAGQAARFAADLRARRGIAGGLRVMIAPLLVPVFPDFQPPPGPFSALILSSATAVLALRRRPFAWPRLAWCVGAQTAQAAQSLGLEVRVAGGEAESLIDLILSAPVRAAAPLLWVHGRETRVDLAARLNAAGVPARGLVVYHQDLQPLDAAARALLQGEAPVIMPVFSPRSAAWLAQELRRVAARSPLRFAAISAAAAVPLRDFTAARIAIAACPDAGAMCDATEALLHLPHGG